MSNMSRQVSKNMQIRSLGKTAVNLEAKVAELEQKLGALDSIVSELLNQGAIIAHFLRNGHGLTDEIISNIGDEVLLGQAHNQLTQLGFSTVETPIQNGDRIIAYSSEKPDDKGIAIAMAIQDTDKGAHPAVGKNVGETFVVDQQDSTGAVVHIYVTTKTIYRKG